MNDQDDEVAHPGNRNNTLSPPYSGQFANSPWTRPSCTPIF
jgi:hypothetical protein